MADLADLAESDAYADGIVERHVGGEQYGKRQRCAICESWWPCDLVSLAALAVLRRQERDAAATLLDAPPADRA